MLNYWQLNDLARSAKGLLRLRGKVAVEGKVFNVQVRKCFCFLRCILRYKCFPSRYIFLSSHTVLHKQIVVCMHDIYIYSYLLLNIFILFDKS